MGPSRLVYALTVVGTGLASLVSTTAPAAQREHSSVQAFAAPADTRLAIDAATVDLRLRTGDVSQIEVATDLRISGVGEQRAEQFIDAFTPKVEVGVDRISITVNPGRLGFLGLGILTARSRLDFLVPHHVIPDITTTGGSISIQGDLPEARPLYLRTATGDIELVGAAATVDIRTASGGSRLDLVRPLERLFARTSSGNIDVAGGAQEVRVDTASGSVWMNNLSGDAEVVTATGRITLSWDRLDTDHRVVVRSDSGRIRITIPESTSPRGSLRTIAGHVRSDFAGLVNDAGNTISLTGDGPEIHVESASGDVTLAAGTWWGGSVNTEP